MPCWWPRRPYSLPDEQELAQHIIRIDQAADLPIILYNYPGRTGVEMGTECLDLIADRSNIVAIKESSGDVNRIHQLTLNYPQIQLSAGAEDQVLEFFVWGAQSWVLRLCQYFPESLRCLLSGLRRGKRLCQRPAIYGGLDAGDGIPGAKRQICAMRKARRPIAGLDARPGTPAYAGPWMMTWRPR